MALCYIVCPHCASEAPRGVRACSGCDAVVRYGTPPALKLVAALPAIGVMLLIRRFFYDAPELVAVLGGVVFGGLWAMMSKVFEGRVVFKRKRPIM